MDPAKIVINGIELNPSLSELVRIAVASFEADMRTNGLGNDEQGKALSALYAKNAREVLGIILNPALPKED